MKDDAVDGETVDGERMTGEVAPWAWRELDAEGALATWTALAHFVDWLVVRYDLGDLVPTCWWAHGALVEELTALWAAWTASYLDPDATPDAPLTWHERFAQCRVRLTEWDRLGCAQRGHRDGAASEWQPDTDDFRVFVDTDCASRPAAHRVMVAELSTEPPSMTNGHRPHSGPEA